jgi:DNA mismatch repair protein MutS
MAKAASPLDTPMMRQYLEVKAERPDCLLLMRMGDFYEAFLDDAKTLARVAGVALTSRNKDAAEPIAMAGVPHHSLKLHLPKLLAAGIRVAVMDQLEDPKEAARDGRSLVRRGLARVITAGTLIDDDNLDAGSANRLVAVTASEGAIAVAALDVSTGRFTVEEAVGGEGLALALARLSAAELVVPEAVRDDQAARARLDAALPAPAPPLATLPEYAWKGGDARRWLGARLGVASLDGFGIGAGEDHLAVAAAAALRYAEQALQLGAARAADARAAGGNPDDGDGEAAPMPLAHVRALVRLHHADHLVLDATCRRNLELLRNSRDGGRDGTLLQAIDRTRSAPGARLLADWLARPLGTVAAIGARHDAVARLHGDDALRADLRTALGGVYDLERLLARLATGRASARDLVQLAASLAHAARIQARLDDAAAAAPLTALIAAAAAGLDPAPGLAAALESTLVEDPPLAIGEGGLIRAGADAEVDRLRALKTDASAWLAAYQAREAAASGLRLKVGYNRVFGYYLELSRAAGERVPAHFVRKQTLAGVERYITPELKEHEDQALGAEDRLRAREQELFLALRARAAEAIPRLGGCANALATLDVVAALAETARLRDWCRPLIDDGDVLRLDGCRHPVVEEVVGRSRYVANDCLLVAGGEGDAHAPVTSSGQSDPGSAARPPAQGARLAVITGPNMAGKSTYIRMVALAVILAQAGSFVPAAAARIGVVDRVFTRVGAGDELSRNLSTFMVEMAETAAILNHATRRSLVVLDEVGRGTSTFDGVSLAWAITEHLHDRSTCRALFATHYHELVDLARDRPGIANLTVAVAEQDEEVVLLHRIVAGAATKSYGIHVARLAGVPAAVIARARAVLATLEQLNVALGERARPAAARAPAPVQLTLFEAAASPTLARLRGVDPDGLSPRQAHDLLSELQRQARSES